MSSGRDPDPILANTYRPHAHCDTSPCMQSELEALPGGELVLRGLRDLRAGRETAEAFLVGVGGPRLRGLGFDVPSIKDPEHRLYDLLARDDSDAAHSRYNALIRRLVSFERALECES